MLRRATRHLCSLSVKPRTGKFSRPELIFSNYHGFELVRTVRIDELNIVAYQFSHQKTKASYFHIDVDDNNNTFCIGFRTPAENNKGVSHVLEHTVLCGSKKYPVRDPFFMMLRRSLSTFMNAMTGADYTLYPFSTTNTQDFKNLLDVYLDAVFHPLLREEDFKQEGHRVEVKGSAESLVGSDEQQAETNPSHSESAATADRKLGHNGVVFNEMRGVVSDPSYHYTHCLMQTMLPGTHYAHISGGFPPDILKLSYQELVSFHKRHYHPSNSITFTYGNQNPEAHMTFLDTYFSGFDYSTPVPIPVLEPSARFNDPKSLELSGPLNVMGNPSRQKRVSVSFAPSQEKNKLEDIVAFSVLDILLSNGPSSPMFKALIESQIGSKYAPMRGYAYYLSSPIVSYGVEGVDEKRPNVEEEVLNAVLSTLEGTLKDGFDQRRVDAVVFQEELQQRHRAADYGLGLCTGLCAMGLCKENNSPLDFINWLPHLRLIKQDGGRSLIPRIHEDLLKNNHRTVLSVSAKKEFLEDFQTALQAEDDALNQSVSEDELKRVEKETAEWLDRVRAPQSSDVLPSLKVSDIPLRAFEEPAPVLAATSLKNKSKLYTIGYPTNELVYVHGLIPLPPSVVDQLMDANPTIPQIYPLLHEFLASTGAGDMNYKELSIATDLVCGGFSFSLAVNESYLAKGQKIVGTTFGFYTTKEMLPKALKLLCTALTQPKLSINDEDVFNRALSIAKATSSSAIQSLQYHGNAIAVRSSIAGLTRRGAIRERLGGLSYCKYASSLLESLQGNQDLTHQVIAQVLEDYQSLTQHLTVGLANCTMWATCEESHRRDVENNISEFLNHFTENSTNEFKTHLDFPPLPNRLKGIQENHETMPIDTSFVGMAVPNNLFWGDMDHAPIRVACQLLANEYLHRRVREEGGAYGAGASGNLGGEACGLTMSSYRDPSPQATIQSFKESYAWLNDKKNITTKCVDEAKLRLFSSLDSPYAPDTYGEGYFYHDIRQTQKQKMRDALLSVTPEDISRVSDYFKVDGENTVIFSILKPSANTPDGSSTQ